MKINRLASTAEARDHLSLLIARTAGGEDGAFSGTLCADEPKNAQHGPRGMRARIGGRGYSAGGVSKDLAELTELQSGSILSDQLDGRDRPQHRNRYGYASRRFRPPISISLCRSRNQRRMALTDSTMTASGRSPRPQSGSSRTIVRQLLSLAYIDGESRQSLSMRFGVPVGTIKTWLRRTLETVRTDCAAFVEAQAARAS